ncbi:MAG TPA: alpha/beta hydrolase-fold protein [Kiritimatiellia bacterium]|nr:alpha/beta hydrolase-fold protein [Kiritimatiellia bacterium]HMO97593.1 alpha/beta hydrolase-fold protein [Kiritimatiellia bacterium]HMP96790.1 alpha/beta hydrolase-fold protein [Kiritimatiellia bacterium]
MSGKIAVTFEVDAPGLDPDAVVYLAGNLPEFGEWLADGVVMSRQESDRWRVVVAMPYGARLEYKITLGDWSREALGENRDALPNYTLAATRNQTVRHRVTEWKMPAEAQASTLTGEVRYHPGITADGVAPRDIVVWLPPGYDESHERYPVLYMHDGQNIVDAATSFIGIEWGVDETADRLIREGRMMPVIVVGIYNTPQRMDEYGAGELGAAYRRFVVEEVKPMIDATYRTRPEREHTATMGSSMGGLVAFLLAWQHPGVFRQAASLSPAFFPEVVADVQAAPSAPEGMRLYMDNGTEGLEQRIQEYCDAMMAVLPEKGFAEGDNFMWFLDEGAEHNEAAWAARLERPLLFLFGVDPAP